MAKHAKALAAAAAAVCLLCFVAPFAGAAGISVPTLELLTRGAAVGGVFALQSRGSLALAVEGGYKFGGSVVLGYKNASLDPGASPLGIDFRGLNVTVNDLGSLPLSLTFFIGDGDLFCSGDEFVTAFGSRAIMTRYRGFLTFPNGITDQPNNAYDGIHQVRGTGLRLSVAQTGNPFVLSVYAYQDSWFTDGSGGSGNLLPGYYSGDLRALAALGPVKIEGFLGGTYSPVSVYGYYRCGLLFHAEGPGVELLAEVGVPKFDPASEISLNLLYVLFEPRVHIGLFSFVPTFFWRPAYYLQQATGEAESFDVNLDLYVGDVASTLIQGGLEGDLRFTSAASTLPTLTVSPYLSFVTTGVLWEFKLDVTLSPTDSAATFAGSVGIRAEL